MVSCSSPNPWGYKWRIWGMVSMLSLSSAYRHMTVVVGWSNWLEEQTSWRRDKRKRPGTGTRAPRTALTPSRQPNRIDFRALRPIRLHSLGREGGWGGTYGLSSSRGQGTRGVGVGDEHILSLKIFLQGYIIRSKYLVCFHSIQLFEVEMFTTLLITTGIGLVPPLHVGSWPNQFLFGNAKEFQETWHFVGCFQVLNFKSFPR